MLKRLFIGLMVTTLMVMIAKSIPDIRRYQKIRSM